MLYLSRVSRTQRHIVAASIATIVLSFPVISSAQLTLTGTSYTENFDGIGGGLPFGWSVYTGANASSLGATASLNTALGDWANTGGGFKSFAAADGIDPGTGAALTGTEAKSVQDLVSDRALGIRQTGTVGDPGAAFTLQLANTVGLSGFGLSFNAQMLNVQPRSITWTLQYGLGDNPTSFTNLATFSDPGAFGSTTITANGALSGIADQNQTVWLRIVALSASSGSGNRDSFGIDDFNLTYSAAAAPYYWDLNGATAGIGGATGTWDTTAANWTTNASGTSATAVFNPASAAIFGGTAGTVNVAAGGVAANGGIQFTTGGYAVQGGTITLGGTGPAIHVANAEETATINAPLAGTAGFTKSGEGTLVLGGTNTYTGSTTIAAGVLQVASNANLGDNTADILLVGGTLRTTADIDLAAGRDLSGTGALDLQGHALKVQGVVNTGALQFLSGGSVTFAGSSAKVGALTFEAATTLSSTPTLNLAGNVTANHTAGTVTINGMIDPGGANRVFTTNDSDAATDLVINGGFTGTGRVQLAGALTAVIQLNGDSSDHTGGFRMDPAAPTVVLGNANALGAGQLFLNGGTLTTTSSFTIPTPISVGGSATFTGPNITLSGDITFFGGAKTLTVDNAVTISGPLGTAAFNVSGGLVLAGTGSVTLANADNAISDSLMVDGPSVTLSGSLSATTLNVTVASGTFKQAGAIAGILNVGDGSGTNDATLSLSEGTVSSLSVGALNFASDAVFKLELDSSLPTSGQFADTLTVTGSTVLGSGLVQLQISDLGNKALSLNTTFTIFDGTAGLTGTDFFKGLPNLARFTVGANQFQIDYQAGADGQDIVLRVVPEPTSAMLLLSGAGFLGFYRRRGARKVFHNIV